MLKLKRLALLLESQTEPSQGDNMQKLILVRHGEYGADLGLTATGEQQIRSLIPALAAMTQGRKFAVVTSTATRARESAAILATGLQTVFEENRLLGADDLWMEKHQELLDYIKEATRQLDVLILVTHMEYVDQFPHYFAQIELQTELPYHMSRKGEVVVIDCEAKSLTVIKPTPSK